MQHAFRIHGVIGYVNMYTTLVSPPLIGAPLHLLSHFSRRVKCAWLFRRFWAWRLWRLSRPRPLLSQSRPRSSLAARHPSSWWPKAADTVGIATTGGISGATGTRAAAFRMKVPTVVGARGGLIRTQIGEVLRAAGVIRSQSQGNTLWPATAKA